jgi:hypothetical protein
VRDTGDGRKRRRKPTIYPISAARIATESKIDL